MAEVSYAVRPGLTATQTVFALYDESFRFKGHNRHLQQLPILIFYVVKEALSRDVDEEMTNRVTLEVCAELQRNNFAIDGYPVDFRRDLESRSAALKVLAARKYRELTRPLASSHRTRLANLHPAVLFLAAAGPAALALGIGAGAGAGGNASAGAQAEGEAGAGAGAGAGPVPGAARCW